jgi:hypothetical protein
VKSVPKAVADCLFAATMHASSAKICTKEPIGSSSSDSKTVPWCFHFYSHNERAGERKRLHRMGPITVPWPVPFGIGTDLVSLSM